MCRPQFFIDADNEPDYDFPHSSSYPAGTSSSVINVGSNKIHQNNLEKKATSSEIDPFDRDPFDDDEIVHK